MHKAGVLEGVAKTCDDAARGKLAAVSKGYYVDPFARYFASSVALCNPGALLNRGHFIRVAAIDSICSQFLACAAAKGKLKDAQIISLGAGLDTRFWQLSEQGIRLRRYIELDQVSVVDRKCAIVATQPALLGELPEGRACVHESSISSAQAGYSLRAVDLCHSSQMAEALSAAGWDPALPTLLLAECVLVYLPSDCSNSLLRWFAERSAHIVFASYEQIGPHDAFGRMMLDNLRRRNCPLLGLLDCPDLEAQVTRCEQAGWDFAESHDLLTLFSRVLSPSERQRVERLEFLDEVEEWQLMLRHYCTTLAVREDPATCSIFRSLKLLTTVQGTLSGGLQHLIKPESKQGPESSQ